MNRSETTLEPSSERRVLTAANGVTLLRTGLALFAGGLFLGGGADGAALGLCSAAVVLDAVDGWVARRWRQQTILGALVDPIADKIATGVVFGTIALRAESPAVWSLFALGIMRDALVTAQRAVRADAGRRGVEPDAAGKLKTVWQYGVGLGILFYAEYVDPGFPLSSAGVVGLMGASVIFSWVSWGRYAASFEGMRFEGRRGEARRERGNGEPKRLACRPPAT